MLGFGLIGALLYFFIISNGTFTFHGPDTLGQAYDAYARAILEGHLDVQSRAIGKEGFYVDGKVYLYYGIMPALLRIPFLLIDIEPPGPKAFVFLYGAFTSLLLHGVLQHIVTSARKMAGGAGFLTSTFFAGVVAWLVFPGFLLVANASIYNEPIGCALVLLSATFFVLRHSLAEALNGELPVLSVAHITSIGLFAALSVHARPTMALMLIVLTMALCFAVYFEQQGKFLDRVLRMAGKSIVPGLLILASVVVFMWLNWLKFGDPLKSGPLESFGYYRFTEPPTAHHTTLVEQGRFLLLRIMPNTLEYFFGIGSLHTKLVAFLGLGSMRLEYPEPRLVFSQMVTIVCAGFGIVGLVSLFRQHRTAAIWYIGVVLAASLTAVTILSYATLTTRYSFEIWPFLFLLALPGIFFTLKSPSAHNALWRVRSSGVSPSPFLLLAIGLSVAMSAVVMFGLKSDPFFNGNPADIQLTEQQLQDFLDAKR